MYCSKCGSRLSGNVRYCPACGARQVLGVVPNENVCSDDEQKREQDIRRAGRRGRRLGNFLVSAAALLILFAGNEKVPDNLACTAFPSAASRFTVQNQKEMTICDGQGTVYTVDIPREILYSADRRQMAYIDRDQELYIMKDMDPAFADDCVTDARMSFYGDTVVYRRNTADSGEELCMYDRRTGSCERLDTERCTDFVLSPDGRSAAFLEAKGNGTLSLWSGGSERPEIAGNVTKILAVSNGAKTVLYQKSGQQLFLHTGREERELSSAEGNICLISNEEQTEFLYSEGGRTWYCSADMEEPVRLSGVKGNVQISCCPENTAYQQDDGLILGRKTLKQMIFATDDPAKGASRLYVLDWNGARAETVMNRTDQFQIAKDGQSVLCLSEQKLYRIGRPGVFSERVCLSKEQNVRQFAADPKLQNVWFSTPEGELYFVKKEECVRVTGSLDRLLGRLRDGVLFLEGQDLYFADGEEKTLVQTAVEDVCIQEQSYAVIERDGEQYYLKELEDAVYLTGSR